MKYILLLLAAITIFGGSQGIYTSIKNPNPTVYDLDKLDPNSIPEEKWVTLKNCDFNLTEAAYFQTTFGNGLAEEIYIPLRSSEHQDVLVLLATKNKNTLDVYNLITSQTDQEKAIEYTKKYIEQVIQENREITGLVRFGIDLDPKEQRQLMKTSEDLVNNFFILDYNKKPSTKLSYFFLGLGLILLLISTKQFLQQSKKS